ncbi:MAG: arginine--tRNA ligase [Acidobacteria bacterium]|nr:arginine--tRNA ligase [Acidobacteriota bacterium]
MILSIQNTIRTRVIAAVTDLYGLSPADLPYVTLAETPSRALGDLAVPLAFELARRLRKAPKLIGQDIAARLGEIPGIARVSCAANGYLNFYFDRVAYLDDRLSGRVSAVVTSQGPAKAIVEHTAINPNKAAHIGHLRNAALGDTLVRALRFLGNPVEIQNYIDDTGVQVADVVVGFRHLERHTLAAVEALADEPRFDYYCWDLYARVTEWYADDKERLAIRARTLHDLEHGDGETAAIAAFVADRIVRCHLKTMARLNVQYDLLTWEGDILRLQFWNRAFETLKSQGTVYMQPSGRLAGCWVMRIEDETPAAAEPDGESAGDAPDATPIDDDDQSEKVIVRSNGTVTYVGKDIAYQFWKFGLLGRDFHYRLFGEEGKDGPLWATASSPTPDEALRPAFGNGHTVYNVIDVRQSYLQKLLKQALAAAGHPGEAERSIHFSYEMVALSHQTARQLGYETEASDATKPFVEVSGRKGLGVKADDLLDTLIAKARGEVTRRSPELPPDEQQRTAEMIAVAAVRYFLVRFSRGKVIAFDIDEALSFEGESGPYLQYAVVRANNIFQKLSDRDGLDEAHVTARLPTTDPAELSDSLDEHGLWALVLESSRLDDVAQQAVRGLEFSVLAKWAFGLAQLFNAYYHRYPVLNEERGDAKLWRAAGVAYFRNQMTRALDLMGIEVPARM